MEVIALGMPIALAVWAAIVMNWRWGVYGIALYTPLTGPVIAALYPSPLGALARDLLIVIPLYLSFFLMHGARGAERVPAYVVVAIGAFFIVVMASLTNPGVPNMMVGGIGAKVWLWYIPMIFVGAAMINTERDLRNILRAIVITGWIPAGVGVIMFVGSFVWGYEPTMRFFYGKFANMFMGGFVYGGGELYRIVGTFQYNSQYGIFCMYMFFPIMMLKELETDRRWKLFSKLSMLLMMVAAFTSGARGNIVYVPMVLILVQLFRFKASGAAGGIAVGAVGLFVLFQVSGIDPIYFASEMLRLTATYGKAGLTDQLFDAVLCGGLFGMGAGTNTGAARHGMDLTALIEGNEKAWFIENFFGKAIIELGILGLFVLLFFDAMILLHCLQVQTAIRTRRLRDAAACGTAMVAFIIICSFKGWALDVDPINYYFFLTIGIVFGMPAMAARVDAAEAAARTQGVPQPAAEGPPGRRPMVTGMRLPPRGAMIPRGTALPRIDYTGRAYRGGYGYGASRDDR